MTVETDIDALVSSTTTRKDTAINSKASLTAYVADSLSVRDQALDYANATLAIRDQASNLSTQASSAASAAGSSTPIEDLSDVAASLAGTTALDVFVYDTSLDSDGGAWRHRTSGTSWYKEPLAGKWLGIHPDETSARNAYANLGSELATNGSFDTDVSGWLVYGDASSTVV